jgi:hypothetical protein
MTTAVADYFFNIEEEDEKLIFSKDNIPSYVTDLSLSLKNRLIALDLYYKTFGIENTIEVINKLSVMYEMSGTFLLKQYLFTITQLDILDPFLQSMCAKTLWTFNNNDEQSLKAVDSVFNRFGTDVSTPYKIEFIRMLSTSSDFKERALVYFIQIIDDEKINCEYRYKTILQMEPFINQSCLHFLSNPNNTIRLRILAAQILIMNDYERDRVETALLEFATDETLDYNARADATDILLQRGSDLSKKKGEEIILKLGLGEKKRGTLYDNAQNVHTKKIEESVLNIIEFLHSFETLRDDKGNEITVDFVKENLFKKGMDESKTDRVNVSFNRISMDRALYSMYNYSLAHILIKVWTFLSKHKDREEIEKRLIDELYETADTCSSGFATRLVNVLSGFSDFGIKISWEEQLISNFTGRINARIRDLKDEERKNKIVEEMTLELSERYNYIAFIRECLPSLRYELWNEFKQHIQDSDFDLYFRKAMIMYEIGEKD